MKFNRPRRKTTTRRGAQSRRGANRRRVNALEMLEGRVMLAADMALATTPWHNFSSPVDVNNDGHVTAFDALLVINDVLLHGSHAVPQAGGATAAAATASSSSSSTSNAPADYLDVNGDNQVTAFDALLVINQLIAGDLAFVHTFATDLNHNPITSIPEGSPFLIETDVQDIRNPPGSPGQGVFSMYVNLGYDSSLVTIPEQAPVPGPLFSIPGSNKNIDLTVANQVTAVPALSTTISGTDATVQRLWTLSATSSSTAGTITFDPMFDPSPSDADGLFSDNTVLTADNIDFEGDSLQILPALSVTAPPPTNEGNVGTTPFVFTVSLSSAPPQAVTVNFQTVDGIATSSNGDYVPTSGTLTFNPLGPLTQTVTVLVNGNTIPEPNETFSLLLSNPSSNALLNSAQSTATATILNDDFTPVLSVAPVQVNNVTSGTTNEVFTVTVSPAGNPVTVQYATSDVGSAIHGVNYTAASGTLTFNASAVQQTQMITVSIIGNPSVAPSETFQLTLSNATNATFSNNLAQESVLGTILPPPMLSLLNPTVTMVEGTSGTEDFVFTASLSAPSTQNILVAFTTQDGTATTADNDYLGTSGTLTFLTGQATTQNVTVKVVGDTLIEPNESFTVNFTPIANVLGSAVGTANILNDNGMAPAPQITIADTTAVAATVGNVNAVFTVSITGGVTQQVTVGYATAPHTAQPNIDYTPVSGILTFTTDASTWTQTITVPIIGLTTPEPDETFFVTLSSVTGGAQIDREKATGTIIRQGLIVSNTSVADGNPDDPNTPHHAVFSVTLSRPQDHTVTVAYATADGTATVSNNDYTPTSGTLTFLAGDTSETVSVAVTPDTTPEANETFFLNLSNPSGAAILVPSGTGTLLNDDGIEGRVILQLADSLGNPLPANTPLNINDNFTLQVFVQDAQTTPAGVYSAYVNAIYDPSLVSVIGPITYGPDFQNTKSGDLSTAGQINEAGGAGGLSPPLNPANPDLLFSIPMQAIGNGLAQFTATPSSLVNHQFLEYLNFSPVPTNAIDVVNTSVNVGSNVLAIDSVSQPEGNVGTTPFVFTVTRFLPANDTATVQFTTNDGTGDGAATAADNDYVPTSGTLTFDSNTTSQTITVLVNGNTIDEPNETFTVTLSNAAGATASNSSGLGTILNDDSPPGISIADAPAVPEGQNASFVVSLDAVSGKTVTVQYATATGGTSTATSGLDYTPTSGTLTFMPGTTQQTITVQTLPEVSIEPTDTFQVVLSNPVNVNLTAATATGSILNVPPATLSGYVYADTNNDGIKESTELGIPNVTITATRIQSNTSQTVLTGADGSYTFIGLQPGTYTLTETPPGFFVDGIDSHLGVVSPTKDQFNGIVLGPSGSGTGYDFGEMGLRANFAAAFINRRAYFASSIVTGELGAQFNTTGVVSLRGGDVWVSFDGGWQGTRIIEALFQAAGGTATMTLYDNNLNPIAFSTPAAFGAQLQYTGTTGAPYFLKVTGTNPSVSFQIVGGSTNSSIPSAAVTPSVVTTQSVSTSPLVSTFASSAAKPAAATATSPSATDLALSQDDDWLN
jgi:hypothetical protein